MLTNELIEQRLPYKARVVALINLIGREPVAMIERTHTLHPFATYKVADDGCCFHGRYFATHGEAAQDLILRA